VRVRVPPRPLFFWGKEKFWDREEQVDRSCFYIEFYISYVAKLTNTQARSRPYNGFRTAKADSLSLEFGFRGLIELGSNFFHLCLQELLHVG
jgi:hypothetical protein